MKSFADLKAWQEGMDLVAEVYRLTALLPRSEQFGLSSQLKRASTSIVANIAEGFGRYSYADKAHKYVRLMKR
ncbi:MAG: four helix bundle protein [Candidatus Peribacteraceae bacterium]|nr:four helix bundle protein [Candidatus Peribacteraceae bacterium]